MKIFDIYLMDSEPKIVKTIYIYPTTSFQEMKYTQEF